MTRAQITIMAMLMISGCAGGKGRAETSVTEGQENNTNISFHTSTEPPQTTQPTTNTTGIGTGCVIKFDVGFPETLTTSLKETSTTQSGSNSDSSSTGESTGPISLCGNAFLDDGEECEYTAFTPIPSAICNQDCTLSFTLPLRIFTGGQWINGMVDAQLNQEEADLVCKIRTVNPNAKAGGFTVVIGFFDNKGYIVTNDYGYELFDVKKYFPNATFWFADYSMLPVNIKNQQLQNMAVYDCK